jgi:hypothetical protein
MITIPEVIIMALVLVVGLALVVGVGLTRRLAEIRDVLIEMRDSWS